MDSLLNPNRWSNNTVSYSFPDSSSYWSTNPYDGYGESSGFGEPWVGFSPLSDSDKGYFSLALNTWENLTNIQ
ncbi:MAG: peptidase M10, partial [Methylophilaceae bacterium]